jgi:hypothetical protein
LNPPVRRDESRGVHAEGWRDLLLERVERVDGRDAHGRTDARGRRAPAGGAADWEHRVADIRTDRSRLQTERVSRDYGDHRARARAEILRADPHHDDAVRGDLAVRLRAAATAPQS